MDNLKDLLDDVLFIMLMTFVLFLSLGLLSLDEQLENMDFNTMASFNSLVTQAVLNTLFSYFSDNASVRLGEIASIAYNVQWYVLPANERLFTLWIIQRANKEFIVTGAKIIPSTMQTVAKVRIRNFANS